MSYDIIYLMSDYKEKQKQHNKEWKKRINEFAAELRKNLPKSEQWFLDKIKDTKFSKIKFESNYVVQNTYIADFRYKDLIIEIDGSIHNNKEQRKKDARKDKFYKKKGFWVVRIRAYDNRSFKKALDSITKYFHKDKKLAKKVAKKKRANRKETKTKNFIKKGKNKNPKDLKDVHEFNKGSNVLPPKDIMKAIAQENKSHRLVSKNNPSKYKKKQKKR